MLKTLSTSARRRTRPGAAVQLIAVTLLLLSGAVVVYAAPSKSRSSAPKPPRPTITRHPAKKTGKSSAEFGFRSTWSRETFQCSLDGSRFAACKDPKRYGKGLAGGWHAFGVRSLSKGKPHGLSAKFRW